MSDSENKKQVLSEYVPPKVWVHQASGGKFASINAPTAGAREEKELPVGDHPLQLYSLGTPNGQKVTILLEELREAKIDVEYDAWIIDIMSGAQFTSGYVAVNPNSKIPCMYDRDAKVRVFESANICLHLAQKFNMFLPTDANVRTECMNWVFWLQGIAPYLGGGFGHFYSYAPVKIEYAIDRFAMEVKRELDVLNIHLADKKYMCGDEYTIADMIIWPWFGLLALGKLYSGSDTFLDVQSYTHVQRWAADLNARPGVARGAIVNKKWGDRYLVERHAASDFEDKVVDNKKSSI